MQIEHSSAPSTPDPISNPSRFITPLRLIFWGGLLVVLDFTFSQTVNGEGWAFDILNDLLGMVFITVGVFRLSTASADPSYRSAMQFVKPVAVLCCVSALHDHFIYDVPPAISFLDTVLSLSALIAIVVFCTAMHILSTENGLLKSASSWRTSRLLFIVIYLVPLGLFYLAVLGAIVTERSFYIDLGPTGLLLIPVFLIPIIHLFVSTSRMKQESEGDRI